MLDCPQASGRIRIIQLVKNGNFAPAMYVLGQLEQISAARRRLQQPNRSSRRVQGKFIMKPQRLYQLRIVRIPADSEQRDSNLNRLAFVSASFFSDEETSPIATQMEQSGSAREIAEYFDSNFSSFAKRAFEGRSACLLTAPAIR